MPTDPKVATSRKTTFVYASLLTAVFVFGGCSKGSGLRTPSTAAGGNGGFHGTGGTGGALEVGGGTQAAGGVTVTGGSTNAGGTTANGGRTASTSSNGGVTITGGSTSTGGTIATGGRSASTSGTGGVTVTGGSTAQAGSGGASAWPSGGSASGGAPSSGGTAGTSPPLDAGQGDGGIVSSGYCEGDNPKLTYQDQTVTPGVTDYRSNLAMDCCNGYGVNLHASAWLGFDVAIELILAINISTPAEYEVGGPSMGARAAVRKGGDTLTPMTGINAKGSLRVLGYDTTAKTWQLGLCLEVTSASTDLVGTKIYVPKVVMGSSQSNKRFQLFLLKDSTLQSYSVATQLLDNLVLADSPLLDLNSISYVERATTKIGFNPGQKIGDTLRTRLGTPLNLPFVAVADGARIYLGTFLASLSSIAPTGPNANVEDITSDGMPLLAPNSGADPRNDERILKALTETGKLVP